ncbi:40-residue YVTN family beta-propeller repeat-containing protein [Modestobacter sp. DSM 44400]|uniref:beta-propeller fold lactonase family protein n=1 Tax=Modestobacter sp. DSM 44400 TaxID=1550230 RepID=UPI000897DD09|nr:cytochrome D1 domain-containing protein [Modestobacter sp. DSM 44400]SDY91003.1 40-residue YVTN family beta-propeller repeat-containing protein [Modestobacter sp. DSM 44400]
MIVFGSHRVLAASAAVVLLTAGGVSSAAAHEAVDPASPGAASAEGGRWVAPANGSTGIEQAPALPGAQPISSDDRIYTADQSSNTMTVINPATNEVLGTLPLGESRLDGVLGPVDTDQVNVHGLGFSRDGRYLDVVSVSSNAVQIVDTATNTVVDTTYLGRSPHEAFISPNGREVWTAVRGEDYVSVVDLRRDRETRRIETSPGPSKVVFSPDGRTAYVNHQRAAVLDVIDVRSKRITDRVQLTLSGSSDLAVSPDGREVWLGHPDSGKTTVVDARTLKEKTVLDTGPRTNHPNFITTAEGAFAWVTVGGLDEVKVYQRGNGDPTLVDTIETSGHAPHGIWPSPDNTRVYVALQKSDAVDVIDTASRKVIKTISVGQDPQALVYVARSGGGSSQGLTDQGLGQRVQTYPLTGTPTGATGQATVRNVLGLDEVDVTARGLTPGTAYDVYALAGDTRTKLLTATSDDTGTIPEALAFVEFFDNGYGGVAIEAAGAP